MHDRSDGGGGRGIGTGDRREEAASAQRCHGETAAQPAEDRIGEIRQPLGDAGRLDEVAGQDEQRQRQQAEEVQALVQRNADIGEGEVDDDADAESALTGPGESLNDRDALVASDGVVHMLAHKLGISSLHVAQSAGNVRLVRDAEAREILEEATEHPEVAPLPPSGLPFTRQSIHSM